MELCIGGRLTATDSMVPRMYRRLHIRNSRPVLTQQLTARHYRSQCDRLATG